MGIKLVATCTEYRMAGVLIHLQLPANKTVFNLLDIIHNFMNDLHDPGFTDL